MTTSHCPTSCEHMRPTNSMLVRKLYLRARQSCYSLLHYHHHHTSVPTQLFSHVKVSQFSSYNTSSFCWTTVLFITSLTSLSPSYSTSPFTSCLPTPLQTSNHLMQPSLQLSRCSTGQGNTLSLSWRLSCVQHTSTSWSILTPISQCQEFWRDLSDTTIRNCSTHTGLVELEEAAHPEEDSLEREIGGSTEDVGRGDGSECDQPRRSRGGGCR